jgi:type II secretory pathway component GspD/PulD (secretin)
MKRFILPLILLICSGQLLADYPLEIIQLRSRPVAEMIPLLQPFIARDGSIAGMHDQLIIRTSPDNLAEIKKILRRLDQPPRRLQISVRQSAGSQVSQRSTQADVNGMIGKQAKVIVGNPHDSGLRLRIKEARTRSHLDATHTLQVLEGHPAFIATGQSVPIAEQTTIINNDTVHQQLTTRYKDVTSGFYVVPRINGSIVTLEVSPHLTRPGNQQGRYEIQQAHTVVSGRLGEWITIGGVSRAAARNGDDILKHAQTASSDDRSIELLVEELAP